MNQKTHTSRSSIFHKIILVLNAFAVLLLLMAYAAYHLKPGSIPYLSLAGLAYPFIFFINLLFVLFWSFTRLRFALISLVFILAGWNHIGRLIQFYGISADDENPDKIKILVYNLQNFLKLNTSTTKYVSNFDNEARIMEFLKEQEADIVCLQEMLNDRLENRVFAEKLANTLNCPNYYYENYFSSNPTKLDALAIFTRYPVISKGHLEYQEKSIGIFVDVITDSDTLRVYNLHLASIHFRAEDYKFWSEITNQQEQEKFAEGTTMIFGKIEIASKKRSHQVKIITSHFAQCPYNILVCGDFNDSPSSYAYNKLSENNTDSFVESGSGLGSTYAGEYFPSFRIDFILYNGPYQSKGFERHKIPYSDHYPISTYLYPN